MPKAKGVSLVGTCPYCGEAVEMIVTKKQAKAIYKGFKLPVREANLRVDLKIKYPTK